MTTTNQGQRRGLTCDVYRPANGDCSNGGISSRVDRVTLIGPDVPEISAPHDAAPTVELRMIPVLGGHLVAEPVDKTVKHGRTHFMFGGCFIYSSDSRFSRIHPLATGAPIPLHDRTESREQCEMLSR